MVNGKKRVAPPGHQSFWYLVVKLCTTALKKKGTHSVHLLGDLNLQIKKRGSIDNWMNLENELIEMTVFSNR
jgi:hypothetical protein